MFTAKMSDGLAQKVPKNKWVEAIGLYIHYLGLKTEKLTVT